MHTFEKSVRGVLGKEEEGHSRKRKQYIKQRRDVNYRIPLKVSPMILVGWTRVSGCWVREMGKILIWILWC